MSLVQAIYQASTMFRKDSSSWKEAFQRILSGPWLDNTGRDRLVATTGIAHRLVWAIPEDTLSLGWRCHNASGKDITKDIDSYLGIEKSLKTAYGSARQDGRAWLWIYTDGPQEEPLRINDYIKVKAIHCLSDSEVTVSSYDSDPGGKNFALPKFLNVSVTRQNASTHFAGVHFSRLVRVSGAPATPDTKSQKINGELSYLQLYLSAIEAMESGWASAGQLNRRLAMPWVRLKNGHSVVAADATSGETDSLSARMQLLKEGMDEGGLMLLCGDDEIGWTAPGLAGLRDLTTTQAERISSVEGIPLSILLGQPPSGMTSDDNAAKRNYNRILRRKQRADLTPVLLTLYERIFGVDKTRFIDWPSLEDMSPLERAQTSLALAQRDQILAMTGVVSIDEIRGRFDSGEEAENYVIEDIPENPLIDENLLPDG